MSKRFTKAERQRIASDFAARNGGVYDPAAFVAEVRAEGDEHPARDWFEWDSERGLLHWQVEQARDFVRDLRITFTIEDVGAKTPLSVREVSMPFALSPLAARNEGGYVVVDPKNPDHLREHCRQAASTLSSWLSRYESALVSAGLDGRSIRQTIKRLEAPPSGGSAAAKKAA